MSEHKSQKQHDPKLNQRKLPLPWIPNQIFNSSFIPKKKD